MLRDRFRLHTRFRKLKQVVHKPDQRSTNKERLELDFLSLLEQAQQSAKLLSRRKSLNPFLNFPPSLPITEHRDAIVKALCQHQVIIVAGETGSGKTTQLPKFCLEAGLGRKGRIACTQPRRVAATSIARQVAEELHTEVGNQVGYRIRFSEKHSEQTLIQFLTDGMLLAETQSDRFLNQYDAIILDEAHERSLNIDFLLGYLKQLLPKRPELRLLITSASINTEHFSRAFYDAPVIEVYGRTYPVEILYRPLEDEKEESGDYTIIDSVSDSVREILDSTREGDVLAFLPGEQEIREVLDRLTPYKKNHAIMPLYGRLTAREQNRIFRDSQQRKVVISTNIAETSLTIPGIRYVVDSGLARISRYQPRTRVQRLPVERIARSNALQRAGRAGRVQSGICIRLFSEDTFAQMREYAEPEILRSNLAGVILQMLMLGLGESHSPGVERIASFPFLDPPSPAVIREGFRLLEELGAADEHFRLTLLGKQLARLPIEPQTARMLIAAREETALREVLVIASGLSIQDPREFPLEEKEKARQMHHAFVHPDSDFLTLLNIWNAYHDEWEMLGSENKMRKFCKRHFLSFVRLREWRDIHRQLVSNLKESRLLELNEKPADYGTIHRSILSGLLNCIARKKEKNRYRTAGGKEVHIFPGSTLFKKSQSWVLAGEQVETSRLYARKAANIEVEWLEPLGGRLCKKTYADPYFDPETGIVQVHENVTLHGLTIVSRRRVPFIRVNPTEATLVFIQEALVAERLNSRLPFFRGNRNLKRKYLEQDEKLRRNRLHDLEADQETFYRKHLRNVGSIHDLNRVLKKQRSSGNSDILFMSASDFPSMSGDPEPNEKDFPDHWECHGQLLAIKYVFSPGAENDGVTLRVHDAVAPHLHPHICDWQVPGCWEERVFYLLKTLPKALRRQLLPLAETAQTLKDHLRLPPECFESAYLESPHSHSTQPGFGFTDVLGDLIFRHFRVRVNQEDWNWVRIPEYLQPRIELLTNDGMVLCAGRNTSELLLLRLAELHNKPIEKPKGNESKAWRDAERTWALDYITNWNFELPRRISVDNPGGYALHGYPGLEQKEDRIRRHLFASPEEAEQNTLPALRYLLSLGVGAELAWMEHELSDLRNLHQKYAPFGSLSELKSDLRENLYGFLFDGPWIEERVEFEARIQEAQKKLGTLSTQYLPAFESLLDSFHETRIFLVKLAAERPVHSLDMMHSHLDQLLPRRFPRINPFVRWANLKRYLRAVRVRAERLQVNPEKDAEKFMNLRPWLNVFQQLEEVKLNAGERSALAEFRWLLEEFRVSLFAPELKTQVPVSARRLEKYILQNFPNHPLVFTSGPY